MWHGKKVAVLFPTYNEKDSIRACIEQFEALGSELGLGRMPERVECFVDHTLALDRELAHATVIIVAQRVGTIMHADQIVVTEAGEVVGLGTHHQLMASCDTYREIVLSQLSEEEVA